MISEAQQSTSLRVASWSPCQAHLKVFLQQKQKSQEDKDKKEETLCCGPKESIFDNSVEGRSKASCGRQEVGQKKSKPGRRSV